jgi:hypothetical protein
LVAVFTDRFGAHRCRRDWLSSPLGEHVRQSGVAASREDEHLQGHVFLEATRQQEVDESPRAFFVVSAAQHPRILDLAEAR